MSWSQGQGDRIWKYCGGSPTSPSPGGGGRGRRFLSSPLLQGGGREGGPAAGSAGVPPASREARTGMRAFGPPSRRDAGAPRRFTDERDREGPRSGCGAGSTPLPTSPLPGGRSESGRTRVHPRRRTGKRTLNCDCPGVRGRAIAFGNFAAARRRRHRRAGVRSAPLFGHRERSRTGPLTPPLCWKFRGGSPTSPSSGGGGRGRRLLSSPLSGGGREGAPAPGSAGVPPASREARTRMRALGPPCRRDAGAPRRFTDERDREGPRSGCGAGSTPLPTSPLPGGRSESGRTRVHPRRRTGRRTLNCDCPGVRGRAIAFGNIAAARRRRHRRAGVRATAVFSPPPFQGGGEKTQGGGEKVAAVRPLSGDSDVGEVSGALALRLLPPSGGRSGGGFRADMPALPGRRHGSGQPPRASMARSMRRMRRGVSARAAQRLR